MIHICHGDIQVDIQISGGNYNFTLFFLKTYVVGTQKNFLIEAVLLSTQNMFRLMGMKIFTI